ncbi:MAG: esterase/lipase family protein [Pirellulaceae bacterium]
MSGNCCIRQVAVYALLAALMMTAGCQRLTRNRAVWYPPKLARPHLLVTHKDPVLATAESVYTRAVRSQRQSEAICVDFYFQAATLALPEVERQLCESGQASGRAAELYRSALTRLIETGQRFGRLDPACGLKIRTPEGSSLIPAIHNGFVWSADDFDQLISAGKYNSSFLSKAYGCHGHGVSAVVVRCRRPGEMYRRREQPFSATVVLRSTTHDDGAALPFVLEISNPVTMDSTSVCGQSVPLQRDITASFAWELSRVDKSYTKQILEPYSTNQNTGLFMTEPYQPGKIPLVLVHGLFSDRYTWANIENEIRARPELWERYQIWGFEYATPEPFMVSAARFRRQLCEVQQDMDPQGMDPALSNMVLVGHSLGGVMSRLQVTHSGSCAWDAVSRLPLDEIFTTPERREWLRELFFFEPAPQVSRIVMMGTPHRGSPWADRPIGRLASDKLEESPAIATLRRRLIADNPGVFSNEFQQRTPNTIDLLEPGSTLLQAIDRLPQSSGVQAHSIIGTGYWLPHNGNSDLIVPVSSAQRQETVTERQVRGFHGQLKRNEESLEELFCILRQHLMGLGL